MKRELLSLDNCKVVGNEDFTDVSVFIEKDGVEYEVRGDKVVRARIIKPAKDNRSKIKSHPCPFERVAAAS